MTFNPISFESAGKRYTFRAEPPTKKDAPYESAIAIPLVGGLLVGFALAKFFNLEALGLVAIGSALGGCAGFTWFYLKSKEVVAFNDDVSKGSICRVIQFYQSKFPNGKTATTEQDLGIIDSSDYNKEYLRQIFHSQLYND